MKKYGLYILLSVFFFSCDKENTTISIYKYSLLKNNYQNLTLNIKEENKVKNYNYLHKIDSLKILDLKYLLNKDLLIESFDTFYPTNKTYNSKSLEFKIYQQKIARSHNRFLVFNEQYGLLANLTYGADYVFLNDTITSSDKEILFKELFLKLNKVNID